MLVLLTRIDFREWLPKAMMIRIFIFNLFFCLATQALAASFTGRVVKVSDGDTIQVMNNNVAEKIRLNGIDSPESGQAYGRQAKEFTADMVAGQVVTVEVRDTDRYGRTVGEVILLDGKNLNREIVTAGYAWWYRKYSNDASLGRLEEEARSARKGLWRDSRPMPPWEWRAAQRGGQGPEANVEAVRALSSQKTANTGTLYHGNTRSGVFHRPSCKDYNCKNCLEPLATREQALSSGYRPCGMCRP